MKYIYDHLFRWIPTALKIFYDCSSSNFNREDCLKSNYIHFLGENEKHLKLGRDEPEIEKTLYYNLRFFPKLESFESYSIRKSQRSLDFTYNPNLKIICVYNAICEKPLNLQHNRKLERLFLTNVKLPGLLDLSNNLLLRDLRVFSCLIENNLPDLTFNESLRSVNLLYCGLTDIHESFLTLPSGCSLDLNGNPMFEWNDLGNGPFENSEAFKKALDIAIKIMHIRKADPRYGPRFYPNSRFEELLDLWIPELNGRGGMDLAAQRAAANGVNVHAGNREQKTLAALNLLKEQQGLLTDEERDQAISEFTAYLESVSGISEEMRRLALHALGKSDELYGPRSANDFGSLLSDPHCGELQISDKEVIARHWIFSKTFVDPNPIRTEHERANAKLGMITALSTAYEPDPYQAGQIVRVCNHPGKVQRQVVNVLQGRLAGVDVDQPEPVAQPAQNWLQIPDYIPPYAALEAFFNIERHREIDNLHDLLAAANTFCAENERVEPFTFRAELRRYARNAEIV